MTTKGYTVLGWLAWQVISRIARRKIAENKVKLGAAATVFAVIAAGSRRARKGRIGIPLRSLDTLRRGRYTLTLVFTDPSGWKVKLTKHVRVAARRFAA